MSHFPYTSIYVVSVLAMRRVGTRQGLTWDLHCRTAVLGTVQYRLLPKTVHKRPRDNRSLQPGAGQRFEAAGRVESSPHGHEGLWTAAVVRLSDGQRDRCPSGSASQSLQARPSNDNAGHQCAAHKWLAVWDTFTVTVARLRPSASAAGLRQTWFNVGIAS